MLARNSQSGPLMEAMEGRLMLSTTIICSPTSINIVADTTKTGQITVSGNDGVPYTIAVAGESPVVKGVIPVVSSSVSITVSAGNAGRVVNVTPKHAKNVTVVGGNGNDAITVGANVFSGNVKLSGGNGTNSLVITSVDIVGNVSITGGTGADTVRIGGASSANGNTTIILGNGANSVTLDNVLLNGNWTIVGGKDTDAITLGNGNSTKLLGNGSISTGAGNDNLFVNAGTYGSRPPGKPVTLLAMLAGEGDDDIRIGGATVGGAVAFAGNVKLDAGAGNDSLKIASNLFGAGVDFERAATILMGAGNDNLLIASLANGNNVLFIGNTTIDLGVSLASGAGDRIGVSVGSSSQMALNGATNMLNLGSGIKDLIVADGIRAGSIYLGQGSHTTVKASPGATVSSNLKSRLLPGITATALDVGYLISIL